MPEGARERILERLRAAPPAAPPVSDFAVMANKSWPPAERYARLRRNMEAVRAEFVETSEADWPQAIWSFVGSQGWSAVAYGPETEAGRRLRQSRPGSDSPKLVAYDRPIEEFKGELFERVDAGFTTTRGGIAETGGLILWPSPEEPRLLSLVPPVHLALLDTAAIHDTFWQAMRSEGWARAMPPNALLVSGPSKTADIEQTLAYGVHGPKRLVVFAIRR
jgi:L-lactate dehydrogenase complex protein LldG